MQETNEKKEDFVLIKIVLKKYNKNQYKFEKTCCHQFKFMVQ